jgi:hypothetical protein
MQGKSSVRANDQFVKIRLRLLIAGAMLVGASASKKLEEIVMLVLRVAE